MYIVQEKSQRQVATILGIGQTSVRRLLKKYNIKPRTQKESTQTTDYIIRKEELKRQYKEQYTKHIIKTCEWCGEEFEVDGAHKNKKFCSDECLHQWKISSRPQQYCKRCGAEIIMTGNRYYKRIYCDACFIIGRGETQSNRIETECGYCHKTIYVIPSIYKENKFCYCNKECMANHYSEIYTGKNSPTWRGGKTHHYTGGFYRVRNEARERDNYTCQICGITEKDYGQQMSVHHIKKYRKFEDKYEANELNNLVCLCEKCHRFVHSNKNTDKLFIND